MLWVVTFIQVFWESHYAYMCIMQGFVSNFADFQFWPYCPSLNCSNFCSSPSLPMEGISIKAFRSSRSFNIKSMQKQLRQTITKWRYIKRVTFYFLKNWSFSTSLLTLLPWGSKVKRVFKTKPTYSFFNLISKSSNKAPEKLVNAGAVSCNFYTGYCRIS